MAVTAQNTIFPNPTPVWNSYDISWMNLVINSGSVYIGVRWMTTSPNVFMAADETADRPVGFAGGYWWNNVANAWATIGTAFTDYRSLFVRAVETHPGLSVSGTDPAVSSVVFAQRTAFTVNVNQPVDATTLQGRRFHCQRDPRDYRDLHAGHHHDHLQLHDLADDDAGRADHAYR